MTSRRRKPVEKVSIPKGEEFVSLPFVTFIKKRCEKFNVLFLLSPEKDIYRDGDPCDGFFEAPDKGESGILVICIGKELNEVLHTIAHEFTHLLQWYEDDPLYLAWDKKPNEKNTFNLEVDTERRALELLKEWGHYNVEAQSRSDKYIKSIK